MLRRALSSLLVATAVRRELVSVDTAGDPGVLHVPPVVRTDEDQGSPGPGVGLEQLLAYGTEVYRRALAGSKSRCALPEFTRATRERHYTDLEAEFAAWPKAEPPLSLRFIILGYGPAAMDAIEFLCEEFEQPRIDVLEKRGQLFVGGSDPIFYDAEEDRWHLVENSDRPVGVMVRSSDRPVRIYNATRLNAGTFHADLALRARTGEGNLRQLVEAFDLAHDLSNRELGDQSRYRFVKIHYGEGFDARASAEVVLPAAVKQQPGEQVLVLDATGGRALPEPAWIESATSAAQKASGLTLPLTYSETDKLPALAQVVRNKMYDRVADDGLEETEYYGFAFGPASRAFPKRFPVPALVDSAAAKSCGVVETERGRTAQSWATALGLGVAACVPNDPDDLSRKACADVTAPSPRTCTDGCTFTPGITAGHECDMLWVFEDVDRAVPPAQLVHWLGSLPVLRIGTSAVRTLVRRGKTLAQGRLLMEAVLGPVVRAAVFGAGRSSTVQGVLPDTAPTLRWAAPQARAERRLAELQLSQPGIQRRARDALESNRFPLLVASSGGSITPKEHKIAAAVERRVQERACLQAADEGSKVKWTAGDGGTAHDCVVVPGKSQWVPGGTKDLFDARAFLANGFYGVEEQRDLLALGRYRLKRARLGSAAVPAVPRFGARSRAAKLVARAAKLAGGHVGNLRPDYSTIRREE